MHKVQGDKMNMDVVGKNERILPTIRLTDKDLPEIKSWEVGNKYILIMEVEQIAMRQGEEWQGAGDDKTKTATFKVLKVGVEETDDNPAETYEEDYAEKRSGGNK